MDWVIGPQDMKDVMFANMKHLQTKSLEHEIWMTQVCKYEAPAHQVIESQNGTCAAVPEPEVCNVGGENSNLSLYSELTDWLE